MSRKTSLVSFVLVLAATISLFSSQSALAQNKTRTVTGEVITVESEYGYFLTLDVPDEDGESRFLDFNVSSEVIVTVDGTAKSFYQTPTNKEATITVTSFENSELVTEIRIGKHLPWFAVMGALALSVVGSFFIGDFLAKSYRMVDYGWKIGLILASVSFSGVIIWAGFPPRLGVDLKGGVTLIYEIAEPEEAAEETAGAKKPTSDVLATLLAERVDPSGTKEIVIRPFGPDRIEIIIPEVGPAEIDNIKRRLVQAGVLKFRIVANDRKHADVIRLAQQQEEDATVKLVKNANGKVVGRWVKVGKESDELAKGAIPDFKAQVFSDTIRDRQTGKLIVVPPGDIKRNSRNETVFGSRKVNFADYLLNDYKHTDDDGIVEVEPGKRRSITEIEVLMATNDGINLEGTHLSSVRASLDQYAKPCIAFNPTSLGSRKFGALTNSNLPENNQTNRLGIVLDNTLISAPSIQGVITSRGQITGSFTIDEVNELVNILRAGQLPAALEEEPLSEDRIDSHLGVEMKNSGMLAITVSLFLVIGFMIFYYRFSGIVACFALVTNLVCIVAMIILVKQPFSLTGLAGLVLTVGMSVDANVLIFERIREEIDRGSTLRMAIRNGFGRATTTIVDANLTTLITAIVLYAIGTEQIRGFAVTLILGILMCMYTAIFCSRVIFDIAERQKWITELGMLRWVRPVSFDFIGKRGIALSVSILMIIVGMVAVGARSQGIYAIDLSGGYSVRVVMEEETDQDFVRGKMDEALADMKYLGSSVTYTVSPMPSADGENKEGQYDAFKIDISVPGPAAADNVKVTDKNGNVLDLGSDDDEMNFKRTFDNLNSNDDDVLSKDEFGKMDGGQIAKWFSLLPGQKKGAEAKLTKATDDVFAYLDNDGDSELSALEFAWLHPREIIKVVFRKDDNSWLAMKSLEASDAVEVALDDGNATAPKEKADPKPEDEKTSDEKPSKDGENTKDGGSDETNDNDTDVNDNPSNEKTDENPKEDDSNENANESGDSNDSSGAALINPDANDLLALADGPFLIAQVDENENAENSNGEDDTDTSDTDTSDTDTTDNGNDSDGSADDGPTQPDSKSFDTTGSKPEEEPVETATKTRAESELTFGSKMDAESLERKIKAAATEVGFEGDGLGIELDKLALSKEEKEAEKDKWKVILHVSKVDADKILDQLKTDIRSEPYFKGSSAVGTSIASNTQVRALGAILASLLGIVAYIWIRFQKVVFGLAAVVALIHDVLFVLGAIAVSYYMPQMLGMEEFKISLPVVAAFLTIIGYSLNDTIVVFDRIREVRGKSVELTEEMINKSIGQTLSRTILTSFTTLIVVAILYGWGGEAIHGFAYALVVGVFVGTYSSIFVASPVLYWLSDNASSNSTGKAS